ncbi:MAG: FxLYD domain-containing protein [Bryobacteraceae bacterium]
MAESSKRLPVPVVIALALVFAGVATFSFFSWRAGQNLPEGPVLTAEAKAYVKNLKLSNVEMKAAESYFKQVLVEIEGMIGNEGDRMLRLVEVNCIFRNHSGEVVLRERVAIAGRRKDTLAPGEIKKFRMPFDTIPQSWNNQMPDLVIARILFE